MYQQQHQIFHGILSSIVCEVGKYHSSWPNTISFRDGSDSSTLSNPNICMIGLLIMNVNLELSHHAYPFLERGQLLSKCNVHAVHAMRLENLSHWFRKGILINEMIIVIHGVYFISSEWPSSDNSYHVSYWLWLNWKPCMMSQSSSNAIKQN